ncbi:unnamed protein product [Onchocerca flexuosa]|uniref:ATP-dependent DNA helicase n=1 Tax=Onchocerca flexuosa TaxID=387005 RepID=A0A183HIV2_9BILA|nr:unnamed protein product [Onchocerca flexuosa]
MLRNDNQPKLCSKKINKQCHKATILTGFFKGKDVLNRILMIPTDVPFQFKRFPIRLAFAFTINKAQGQSLELCGVDLETDYFSRGQLYVACSRVGKQTICMSIQTMEQQKIL